MKPPTMTELGEWNCSDRVLHKYTFLYDEIFAPIRYSAVRVLDIGYARGRGTRMLAEYFPRGTIHSFDIEPDWRHYNNLTRELQRRIKLYKGDQSDPESIQQVLQQVYDGPRNEAKRGYRQFDTIIDDGSHDPNHQRVSFEKLWPEVKSGGLYIIEDMHPYYHVKGSSEAWHETVSWLFTMVHKLNRYGDKHAKPILKDVDWLMFSYNQALIRKTSDERV